jgi:hypothetical protein
LNSPHRANNIPHGCGDATNDEHSKQQDVLPDSLQTFTCNPKDKNRFWTQISWQNLKTPLNMLSTFENAQRQHARRKERERHLKHLHQMEAFSKSCEFEDFPASSLADAISGFPLQKAPGKSSVNAPWWRKSPAKILGVSFLVCIILIGFLAGVDFGEHEVLASGETDVNEQTMDPIVLRRDAIASLILDWGLTSLERLRDASSPAFLAHKWLVYTDTESVASPMIQTRFALACLYFATHPDPHPGNQRTSDRDWLSSDLVCSWYGVDCVEFGSGLGMFRSLNLSSNALAGTIPDELGLLAMGIFALDLSQNQLTGTIPESLFLLKNMSTSIQASAHRLHQIFSHVPQTIFF